MNYWGKLIGGLLGLLLGGPFGLFLGLVIGHLFDKSVYRNYWRMSSRTGQQSEGQQAFFDATFLVMGYVAKADGRVSEEEIRAARAVMDRMGLNERLRQRAMELFSQGKQADFNLDQTLSRLMNASQRNHALLRLFIELQLQVARVEGAVSQEQQRILQHICQRLGFAPLSFVFFEDLFEFAKRFQQGAYAGQQGYHQQQGYHRPRQSKTSLREAYVILEIAESATDAEVKRAYRRLMSQHHPDKLVSKGLPEEMIKLATEKTQKIKAAYEQICEARGVK